MVDLPDRYQSLHIVQIGQDEGLLTGDPASEPVARQLAYSRELARLAPGSRMSIIILTKDAAARRSSLENLTLVPAAGLWGGRGQVLSQLRQLHRELPIDLITTQTVFNEAWLALLFARRHRLPVVGQVHFDLFSPDARRDNLGRDLGGRLRYALGLRLLHRFAALRVVGQGIAREMASQGLHQQVHTLPVMVDMAREADSGTNAPGPRPHRVLFVGRLCHQKNLEDWLRVAARVAAADAEVIFDIVGDGPLKDALVQQAQSLGLASRVCFHGFIPNRQLGPFYREAAVFLLTSHYEGFGRVLIESYAHQTPVVAPLITGVEDIVDPGRTGFLHPPGDLEGMAASVLRLLLNPEEAQRLGAAGQTLVRKRFNPQSLMQAWVALLVQTVDPSPIQLLPPRRRTWQRWQKIARSPFSLLRTLEYEALDGLTLSGRTLDVGGGEHTSYRHLLNIQGTLESVNLSPRINPTHLADLNEPLPFKDQEFDNILSLNTLEHVRRDTLAIQEAMRVLKKGGQFHLFVPFFYPVHASPSDYHRHTAYWWLDFLSSLGLPRHQIRIEPLVWDSISSAASILRHGRVGRKIKAALMLRAVLKDRKHSESPRLPDNRFTRSLNSVALGYYISGVK